MKYKNQLSFAEKVKRGFFYAYTPIFIICLFLLCWLMYYYLFLSNKITISTAYLDKASYAEDETFFIDINYYSNRAGNGEEVFELKFNYYTDTRIPDKQEDGSYGTKYMYSTGIQLINGIKTKSIQKDGIGAIFSGKMHEYYTITNGYCYDTEMGGNSFGSLNRQTLLDQDKWIFDIDGQLCLIQTKGDVNSFMNLWIQHILDINTSYFIMSLYNTVKSLEVGENIFELNLSEYFFVTLQNEDGSFNTKPTDDVNFLYTNIHVNVSDQGMIRSNQSMFGIVEDDADWSLYGTSSDSYWQVRTEYDLYFNDFSVVYEEGCYYLKIKNVCLEYLKPFNYIDITINLDLDNIYISGVKINVSGFDKTTYDNIEIYKLKLNSTEEQDFIVQDKNIIVEADDTINIIYPEVSNA